jgi:hypothetical protein
MRVKKIGSGAFTLRGRVVKSERAGNPRNKPGGHLRALRPQGGLGDQGWGGLQGHAKRERCMRILIELRGMGGEKDVNKESKIQSIIALCASNETQPQISRSTGIFATVEQMGDGRSKNAEGRECRVRQT